MGKRGPKKEPTSLKILKGTARREDLERGEPKPKPIALKCPRWLSKAAKKEYKKLAPQLERIGLLTAIDGEAFALMLTHMVLAKEAARTLAEEGTTVEDERGLTRKHPACQILRDNSQMFRQYMAEFGMTPSARAKFDFSVEDDEDDEMERFLKEVDRKRNENARNNSDF